MLEKYGRIAGKSGLFVSSTDFQVKRLSFAFMLAVANRYFTGIQTFCLGHSLLSSSGKFLNN